MLTFIDLDQYECVFIIPLRNINKKILQE